MDTTRAYTIEAGEPAKYREALARNLNMGVNVLMFLALLSFLTDLFGWRIGYDDTDAKDHRSGLHLYTDNGTGCQYLAPRFGGLTPRIGGDGKQMGCRP